MAGASTGPTAIPPFDVSASLLLDEPPRRTDLSRAGASIREDNHVGDDVSIGAVVAGNPARVIKQVAALTCPPGWFERPYTWPRYEPPWSGEKGSPAALSSPFALPRTGAFSTEVFGARAATQHADTGRTAEYARCRVKTGAVCAWAKATTDLLKLIEAPPVASVHRLDCAIGQERVRGRACGGAAESRLAGGRRRYPM